MNDSVFNKIIRRELPAEIIYENDEYIVILSIQPHNPGHSLVIPKNITTGNFWEMEPTQLSEMVLLAQKISQAIMYALSPARVGLVFEGFGVTDHVHVNLIPINQPGDLDHDRAKSATPEQLHKDGEKIRSSIRRAGL